MSDEPRRRLIEIGTMPSGYDDVFLGEGAADPLAAMLREGNARLDAEHAARAKALAAKAADAERAKATRRALTMRRLGRALKMFTRIR
jgi:hypothetical protein